jgi:hypothetical protein
MTNLGYYTRVPVVDTLIRHICGLVVYLYLYPV